MLGKAKALANAYYELEHAQEQYKDIEAKTRNKGTRKEVSNLRAPFREALREAEHRRTAARAEFARLNDVIYDMFPGTADGLSMLDDEEAFEIAFSSAQSI